MKTNVLYLAFLIILIAAGCKTENPVANTKHHILDSIEIVTDTASIDLGFCFPALLMQDINYIIKDSIDYAILLKGRYPLQKCDSAVLPEIDFTKYSLLAKRLENHVYSNGDTVIMPVYLKSIYNNYSQSIIRYHITAIETRDSGGTVEDVAPVVLNLIRIPKIPNNWSIQIDTTLVIKLK